MSKRMIGVDVGGTFTDVFVLNETDGTATVAKVPTTRPDQSGGFLEGIGREVDDLSEVSVVVHGTTAGQSLAGTPVDQVFIGSCTNGRIEDLRAAAAVMAGRRAKVPGLVSPGSQMIKTQAEQEGLDKVFTDAGLEWAASGCSMCVGMNGDLVGSGKRCASSTNRNFKGRQGRGSRTHLMSPVMVAAAAVTGQICDVRPMLQERDI